MQHTVYTHTHNIHNTFYYMCISECIHIYRHTAMHTPPNPRIALMNTPHFWADREMIGTEKALHQHIQAYGMWTHWWAHTYGAGGFCCFAWEEGTELAFDQPPNHRAQHIKYSLKIPNCLGCIIFLIMAKKPIIIKYNTLYSSLQFLWFSSHRIKKRREIAYCTFLHLCYRMYNFIS